MQENGRSFDKRNSDASKAFLGCRELAEFAEARAKGLEDSGDGVGANKLWLFAARAAGMSTS